MTTTTPIYFRLRKSSKRPVDCFTKVTKSKNVDMTSFNKGLRTGYISNITAVDLDLYKGGNSTDFVNKFGEDYIEKFNTLTPTVESTCSSSTKKMCGRLKRKPLTSGTMVVTWTASSTRSFTM